MGLKDYSQKELEQELERRKGLHELTAAELTKLKKLYAEAHRPESGTFELKFKGTFTTGYDFEPFVEHLTIKGQNAVSKQLSRR